MIRHLKRVVCAGTLSIGLSVSSIATLHAQQTEDEPGELRVFLDCEDCDSEFIRTEIPWIAFMRDRVDADVHILVTTISTGGGGQEYTINLVGRGRFSRNDTLRFTSQPNQAEDAIRRGLTRTLQLALMPYVLQTPQAERISIAFSRLSPSADRTDAIDHDPWRAWVFRINLEGDLEEEQRQGETQVEAEFSATRVTDQWKTGFNIFTEINRDHVEFEREGQLERRTTRRDEYGSGIVVIRSLGNHWGAGAEATLRSSTFQNIDLASRSAAAVEYSVWPYADATRRQLTFQYSVGVSSFRYIELTIFDKLHETRPTQSFIVGYDVEQPWGEADVTLESASFLDDLEHFRLAFDANVDVRLFRGFSLSFGGGASLLRDQISIVKDPDPDDVLQELRELQTDYRYDLRIGLSYAFGSIFNSVVNPRFGGGTGEIIR